MPKLSIKKDYPFDYRIFGWSIRSDNDLYSISRQSYGLFDWLSNVGGFLYALQIIGYVLVAGFNMRTSDEFFTKNLFKVHS